MRRFAALSAVLFLGCGGAPEVEETSTAPQPVEVTCARPYGDYSWSYVQRPDSHCHEVGRDVRIREYGRPEFTWSPDGCTSTNDSVGSDATHTYRYTSSLRWSEDGHHASGIEVIRTTTRPAAATDCTGFYDVIITRIAP